MKTIFYLLKRIQNKVRDIVNDYACKYPVVYGTNVSFKRTARVDNISGIKENIKIGNNTVIRGELLTFQHGGLISVGDYCYIGELSRIWSAKSVAIGNRVLIAHNVNIHDNNAHPIDPELRHKQYKQIIFEGHPKEDSTLNEKAVNICDDVWIGFNATILKGVTIGKGSIVAACSLVTADVPENVIVAGNPAVVIKKLK